MLKHVLHGHVLVCPLRVAYSASVFPDMRVRVPVNDGEYSHGRVELPLSLTVPSGLAYNIRVTIPA